MTQSEIESALNDLNNLVLNGKSMEAFEKYYHDDVIMQENNYPPTISKAANRERERQFYGDVTGVSIGAGERSGRWRRHLVCNLALRLYAS